MFGEFSGAVGAAYGPQSGSESRICSSILPLNSVVIAGLTLVVDPRDTGCDYTPATRRKSPQNLCLLGAFVTVRQWPLLGFLEDVDEPPALRCRQRASLHQRNAVADPGDAVLVVRLDLLGGPDDLAVQRVPHPVFELDDDGLFHLVRHHVANRGPATAAR